MSVTLADIARHLGISMMTVSRAINNKSRISARTRERVLEAAREMGYQPNHLARGLATRRSLLIGLVVPDLTHSYFAEFAKAVGSVARPAGYEVLICSTEENEEQEVAEVAALRHRTDGLIVASSLSQSHAGVYRKLIREGTKVVFIDRQFERVSGGSVVTDNVRVGQLVTEHFIKLGYRRIGHLRGTDVSVSLDRCEGYRLALREHGIKVDESLIRDCSLSEAGGYAAMSKWIAEGSLPRAIFAVNDPSAIGAMSALLESGIRVPDSVALSGAGAIHYGPLLRVPLTTVDWDLIEMGQRAADLLIEKIEGRANKGSPRTIVIPPRLVVRASCGAQSRRPTANGSH